MKYTFHQNSRINGDLFGGLKIMAMVNAKKNLNHRKCESEITSFEQGKHRCKDPSLSEPNRGRKEQQLLVDKKAAG